MIRLPLKTILKMTNPPPEIDTVQKYQQLILSLLDAIEEAPQGSRGRPPGSKNKNTPDILNTSPLPPLAAIPDVVQRDMENYPEAYTNNEGLLATTMHRDQAGVGPMEVRLNNGIIVDYSTDFILQREEGNA